MYLYRYFSIWCACLGPRQHQLKRYFHTATTMLYRTFQRSVGVWRGSCGSATTCTIPCGTRSACAWASVALIVMANRTTSTMSAMLPMLISATAPASGQLNLRCTVVAAFERVFILTFLSARAAH